MNIEFDQEKYKLDPDRWVNTLPGKDVINSNSNSNKKEINQNIRSRSAKLRYAIRNNNSFFYPEEFKKNFESYFKLEEIRL